MALDFDTSLLEKAYEPDKPSIPTAPIEDFEEDENNPRFEHVIKPEFDEDIKQHGILQPLVCLFNHLTGKLKIRFGSRRFRSAKRVGLKEIPYVITEDPRQFDDYAQVSENEQREPLTPLELAKFIQRKIDAGDKKKLIAERLHINAGEIAQYQALIDAPPFITELYESKKCRSVRYLYELRNLYNQHGEKLVQLCYEVNNFTRSKIDEITVKLGIENAAMNRIKILAAQVPTKQPEGYTITDRFNRDEPIAKDVPKSENTEILCITKKSNQEPQKEVVFETKSATDYSAVPVLEFDGNRLPEKLEDNIKLGIATNPAQTPLDLLYLAKAQLTIKKKFSLENFTCDDALYTINAAIGYISSGLNPLEPITDQLIKVAKR